MAITIMYVSLFHQCVLPRTLMALARSFYTCALKFCSSILSLGWARGILDTWLL